ncbi:MAG TPA: FAD-binding oxidoreductase, partial [Microbacterium sp.]|nr:FAD-binding oxidoreductase [Microbacterium sp.]
MTAVTDAARAVAGSDTVPRYSAELPAGGRARRILGRHVGAAGAEPVAVYLPACVGSMFGAEGGGAGASAAFTALLTRAGIAATVPDGIEALCCSTPWTSKGFPRGRDVMQRRVVDAV